VNAKGGLLGRPVEIVVYDDQSNPSTVPGIYTKLLDVDKVDLVVSGYATNMIAPAMPVVIEHKRTFLSLFGHRQLRFLDPGKDLAVSRRHGISEEVSGKAVRGASIRSAITWPVGLCEYAGARRRSRGNQGSRPG
jgi:hypothetical protein